MSYRAGQAIECPLCGQTASIKVASRMDGWTKVGEYYACTLCGGELAEREAAGKSDGLSRDHGAATGRLASFLGTSQDERGPILEDDGERRFCRDCSQYLVHPFVSRCLKHDRPTGPMDDCEDFERRPHTETEDA